MSQLGASHDPGIPRDRSGRRTLLALLASLLLNAIGIWSTTHSELFAFLRDRTGPVRQVSVAPLSAQAWEANRAIQQPPPGAAATPPPAAAPAPQERAATAPKAPAQPPLPRDAKQIVELGDEAKPEAPDPRQKTVIAEHDARAKKNTISRDTDPTYEHGRPRPGQETKAAQAAAQKQGEAGEADRTADARDGKAGGKDRARPSTLPEDALAFAPGGELRGGHTGDAGSAGPGVAPTPGGRARGEGAPNLGLAPEEVARIAGGPRDLVPGAELGDVTALNAQGWKYATYVNRMGTTIGQHWRAAVNALPDGYSRYLTRTRVTVLRFTLNPDGRATAVRVLESCGVDQLDAIAVHAIESASPFLNPPRELVSEGEFPVTFRFTLFGEAVGRRTPRPF